MRVLVGSQITTGVVSRCPVNSVLTYTLDGELATCMKFASGWSWFFDDSTGTKCEDGDILYSEATQELIPLVLFIPEGS